MKCQHCGSEAVVKNGCSRHGRQRWLCRDCRKTCGERDQRQVTPAKRATERLVGVSHNAVMNWGLEAVAGKALAHVKPDEVEWVEADELWTYVGQKKRPAGCGGRLIVPPRKSAAGRWGIVEPKRPAAWLRSFLAPPT